MTFNLDSVNLNRERVGYFPYTTGIDREGNECMMVVCNDPSASGCNPMHWRPSLYNRYGHEFASQEQAEMEAKYAQGSWSVKSVNRDKIKIGVVKFTVVQTAVNVDNAE